MNRSIIALLIGLFCLSAAAQTNLSITATVTLTNNVSGATNGQSIVVNGQVRTWTNLVSTYSSQLQSATNVTQATTNIYNGFAISPQVQTILGWNYTNAITLQSFPGYPMTVTITGNWATVSFSTNVLTFATVVRVPVAAVGLSEQTNVASGLATWLDNAYSTNQIHENAPSMQNFLGNTNTQTVVGQKNFTNALANWYGSVTNSPAIGGFIQVISNGLWKAGILLNPTMTNGVNYGNAFSSPGTNIQSEQFGLNATAKGAGGAAFGYASDASGGSGVAVGNNARAWSNSAVAIGASSIDYSIDGVALGTTATASGFLGDTALGATATASGGQSTAIGLGSTASGTNSMAMGDYSTASYANSIAIGVFSITTASNQIMIGSAGSGGYPAQNVVMNNALNVQGILTAGSVSNELHSGTTTFPAGTDMAYQRATLSSLANGNNAAIPIGTNIAVEVSGPTAAFAINGIASGRDGKYLILLNQTGFGMTIANESGVDPVSTNRIRTLSGSDIALPGNSTVTLWYNGNVSRWILLNAGTVTTSQVVPGSLINTNWVSGQIYSNTYSAPLQVMGMGFFQEAAVAGVCRLNLESPSNNTNFIQDVTSVAGTIIGSDLRGFTPLIVPVGGTWSWTNQSTGIGNSSAPTNGQFFVF